MITGISNAVARTLIATAALAPSMAALAAPYLDHLDTVKLVASTVPANGDVNPYGIAVIPRSVGTLQRGNVLVSNFNDSANLQGTGTTIVQVSPQGTTTTFAQLGAAEAADCPGGIGLTTALVVLRSGWVVVGSLPTADGTAATARAGCLLVIDSEGKVVETLSGGGIDGPWDMTASDREGTATLFVTNVLNGDVTEGAPHVVNQGTVLRIVLDLPRGRSGVPSVSSSTIIGSGFAETADPAALVIGPTGLGLAHDGSLYVADSVNNRITAIPDAVDRTTTAFTGVEITHGGALNDPLGLLVAPNGDIVTANGDDGNLVETTPGGSQVVVKTVTPAGGGALFGIARAHGNQALYFVDDSDNTLKALVRTHPPMGDEGDDDE